jgi:hypothetical protein
MVQPLSGHEMMTARRPAARVALLWGGISLLTIVLLATFALWFHYGTTVFFEMIAAGFAACF